jgi:DNA helicase-2/ATP-dependent DNA helicase PcrA
MNDLLKHLNPQQLAAVTLPAQHALVLAGAGSGKTRVLTTRIAWLIQTGNVAPHAVLAVTFTNKAAREMLTRLSAMVPVNLRGMWMGTFHGLCNRLLRAHHRDAQLPQTFTILDSQDQLAVVKRVLKSLSAVEGEFPARKVQYFINDQKEEGRRPPDAAARDEFERRCIEFYIAYDALCQKEGSVDFPELLLRCFELLSRNELIRTHYQSRFRHILVDEFQDTNRLQYRWLKLLCSPATAMFAVGDDDQSIYRFRGANVGNMADFERDFRVKNLIRLEQNYRSQGNILAAANGLISNNRNRLGKNLWTEAGEGEPVRVFEAESDAEEAQWLADEIQALGRDGYERRDMAVLYRSNAQSRVIEHALFSVGIPYRVYGGLRFFERAEVKHALAYLRLVSSPEDDGAFLRVVNFPARGIGARTIENLQDAANTAGVSLWRGVQQIGGKSAGALASFVQLITRMRDACAGLTLPEVVELTLKMSGLSAHFEAERDGGDRVENLNELVNAAIAFVQEEGLSEMPALPREGSARAADSARAPATGAETSSAGTPQQIELLAEDPQDANAEDADSADAESDPLASFLAHASLESGENQAEEGGNAVQMMTAHSAKGLEFHAVFITGLEEGLFPHENSLSERDGLEEERRLMYVAITRARTRLYVSFAQNRMLHGYTRPNVPSRFIGELPPALLKWLTQRKRAVPGGQAWSAAAPLERSRSTRTAAPFRIGQGVVHPKFGEGVVVDMEGSGDDLRVRVNFGGKYGMKELALQYAKLTPA